MAEYQRKKFALLVIRVDKRNMGATAAFLAEYGFPFSFNKSYLGDSYNDRSRGLAFSISRSKSDGDGRTLVATDGQFIVIERNKLRVLDPVDFWDEFEVMEAGSPILSTDEVVPELPDVVTGRTRTGLTE